MLQIRDYRPDDALAIVRLFYDTVRTVNRRDYSAEQVAAWAPEIPDPAIWHRRMIERCTLVGEESGEVLGFVEIERDGHLDYFFCRADTVGRGIGGRLYEALEAKVVGLGLARIFVEASISLQPFLARRGFRVVERQTVVRRGVPMTNFKMEKSLTSRGG
jgi:GNAT superfamily N-acetyltransferase